MKAEIARRKRAMAALKQQGAEPNQDGRHPTDHSPSGGEIDIRVPVQYQQALLQGGSRDADGGGRAPEIVYLNVGAPAPTEDAQHQQRQWQWQWQRQRQHQHQHQHQRLHQQELSPEPVETEDMQPDPQHPANEAADSPATPTSAQLPTITFETDTSIDSIGELSDIPAWPVHLDTSIGKETTLANADDDGEYRNGGEDSEIEENGEWEVSGGNCADHNDVGPSSPAAAEYSHHLEMAKALRAAVAEPTPPPPEVDAGVDSEPADIADCAASEYRSGRGPAEVGYFPHKAEPQSHWQTGSRRSACIWNVSSAM